jgi:hypothetical protein
MDHPHPQCEYITLQDYLDHKAMRSTLKTKREKKLLDAEFSKHSIDNAFMDDDLPLSDSVYGIFSMLPPERLHVTCEGITKYMFDCLRNIIDRKIMMNDIETVHHNLNHRLRRNSERDFPRGSDRNGCLKNTLVNASERRGNLFRLLCLCHTDQISG